MSSRRTGEDPFQSGWKGSMQSKLRDQTLIMKGSVIDQDDLDGDSGDGEQSEETSDAEVTNGDADETKDMVPHDTT